MNKKYKVLDKYYQLKYGITWQQRMDIWKKQGGRCAICKRHEKQFNKRLAVDHSHAADQNGKVRGLLCFYCNKFRVGRLTSNWAKLVYEYLLSHGS